MKTLLQQTTSGLYYQAPGQWVANPKLARVFPNTTSALQFCLDQKIQEAQIVLLFGPDEYTLRLRIRTNPERLAPPSPSEPPA